MSRLRLALALIGFLAAVLGVATDDRRIVWIAIALLSASFFSGSCNGRPRASILRTSRIPSREGR